MESLAGEQLFGRDPSLGCAEISTGRHARDDGAGERRDARHRGEAQRFVVAIHHVDAPSMGEAIFDAAHLNAKDGQVAIVFAHLDVGIEHGVDHGLGRHLHAVHIDRLLAKQPEIAQHRRLGGEARPADRLLCAQPDIFEHL